MQTVLILLFLIPPIVAAQEEATDPDLAAAVAADAAESAPKNRPASAAPSAGWLSENPDISLIADGGFGVLWNRQNPIEQGGHAIDKQGFALQGLELAIGHAVDPYFRFDLNFQFVGMHLEEAYITSLSLPWNFQVRGGVMSAQMGRENQKCIHSIDFVNYSLLHTRFLSQEHFSGLGGEISWLAPTPWYLMLIGQVLDTKSSIGLFRSNTFAPVEFTEKGDYDGLEDFVYLARIVNFFELASAWSLNVGLSGAWGQSRFVPDNRATIYGADILLKYRDVEGGNDSFAWRLDIEALLRDQQTPGDFARDIGFFVSNHFQIDKRWSVAARGEWNDRLHSAAGFAPDMQVRGAANVTFNPTHFSKFRLEYEITKNGDTPPYHGVFLQAEVVIGAHGAHIF